MLKPRFIFMLFLSLIIMNCTQKEESNILELHKKFIDKNNILPTVKSIYIKSKIEGYGFKGTSEAYYQFPSKFHIFINLGPIKKEEIYDGEKFYSIDMNGAISEKTLQKDIANVKLQAFMSDFSYLNPKKNGIDISYLPKENNLIPINFSYQNSDSITCYFDNTGKLLKIRTTEMGMEIIESKHSYREISGIMISDSSKANFGIPGMDITTKTEQFILNPIIPAHIFTISSNGKENFSFRTKSNKSKLKFEFVDNHIFLKVGINNNEKLWFIYDTGAQASLISKKTADKLKLNSKGQLLGLGATGTKDITLSEIDSIIIGNVVYYDRKTAVVDLENLNNIISHKFSGLIGFDIISETVNLIDFKKSYIEFINPKVFKQKKDFKLIKAQNYMNFFMIHLKINGVEGNFIMDTGSNSYVDINATFAKRTNIGNSKDIENTNIAGVGGTNTSQILKDQIVDFYGDKIKTHIGLHTEKTGVFGIKEIDGIIGSGFLKNYIIITKYDDMSLYIKKNNK